MEPEDWHLLDSEDRPLLERDGRRIVERAAAELDEALDLAIDRLRGLMKFAGVPRNVVARKILELHQQHIVPVQSRWSHVGAEDTEPREVALCELRTAAAEFYGLDERDGYVFEGREY